jgi:dihydrodipicolinate synthase/N-acetylneuraminate lyase
MKYLGFKMGPYRLPLTEPSEESKRKIEEVIDGLRESG